MGFENGKYLTEKDFNSVGEESEYRCGFCGVRLKIGQYYRRIPTSTEIPFGGNPLACSFCDCGDDRVMIDLWKVLWRTFFEHEAGGMWYFIKMAGKYKFPEELKDAVGFDE